MIREPVAVLQGAVRQAYSWIGRGAATQRASEWPHRMPLIPDVIHRDAAARANGGMLESMPLGLTSWMK